MEGKAPRAIITDQDPAIKAAIKVVFPEACHRFCLWHIMKKIPEKLGSVRKADPKFMYRFNKCIYDTLTIQEFESRWKKLIETYKLEKHEWLIDMYECRKQWIPVFLKDTFFAGMSTSQRSESMNSYFDDYVNQKCCLKDFVDQYGLALNKRYNDEEKADFDSRQNEPPLKTTSPYEAQMASIYTWGIFKKFQVEVLGIPSCYCGNVQLEEGNEIHTVKELVTKPNGKKAKQEYNVTWDSSENRVSCICRLFEFRGFLCRHALVVLFAAGVYEIPPHYILKRWTRDAKIIDVFDEACGEVREDGPEYKAKCFSDLSVDCIKVAEEGSLSKEKYKAANFFLKEALEMLSKIDPKDAGPSHQHNENKNQYDSTLQNVTIQDPGVSKSRGRQRIKSGVEMSKTKGKPYSCSYCKEPGHNILKCKKKLEEDANKVQELNKESNLCGENLNKEKDGSDGICGAFSIGGSGNYDASRGNAYSAQNSGKGRNGDNMMMHLSSSQYVNGGTSEAFVNFAGSNSVAYPHVRGAYESNYVYPNSARCDNFVTVGTDTVGGSGAGPTTPGYTSVRGCYGGIGAHQSIPAGFASVPGGYV